MPIAIPALITAAATAGTAIYSANAAGKAQDKALSAQNASTQQSLAAQQAALDRITNIQQPFVNAGSSVLPALASRVNAGAPNFSAPSYANPQASAYPAAAGQPIGTVTQGTVPAAGGKLGNGVSIDPASAGPAQPAAGAPQAQPAGPDWDAYIQANPDVAAWIAQGHGDPSLGPNQTPEQAAAFQYKNTGQSEGRALPTTAPVAAAQAAPQTPLNLGTASSVVADYTRPDQGISPNASDFFDPSKFTASPGYQFRLNQGLRNTNASFGAKGLLQSGAALQGFNEYAQNSASSEYANWFNQQQQLYQDAANRFVSDRNNTNNNFTDDRSYGTNLALNNRDFANNQYNTQTQNMFQLAGVGSNAANAVGSAVTGNANNSSNLFQNQGNNAANAAYANGQTQAGLAGTIGATVSNLFSGTPRSTGIPAGNSAASPTYAYPTVSQLGGNW